jgi:drug/metabolite transporter (DMT)-like permease
MLLTSHLRGIVALILALGMFIASDTASKFVFADVPLFEVVTLRAGAAAIMCLGLILALGQGAGLRFLFNPLALARGLCEVGANLGFTVGILHLPLADVTAIAQTAPLLLLVGAKIFFGEALGTPRLVLIALGIIGAMLVAQPGATAASPFAFFGFLVAVSAAARDLIARKVPSEIPVLVVALSVLVSLTLAGAIGMAVTETPVVPSPRNSLLLLLAGVLMVGGHAGIYYAFKNASARTLAPFMYVLTLWAVVMGLVFFGDVPNALAVAGMALIVLAGVMVLYVDSRTSPTDKSQFTAAQDGSGTGA